MEKVSGQKRKSRLRGWVFWPPFLVLLMVLILLYILKRNDEEETGEEVMP